MQSISTERRPVSLSVTFMGASIHASRREYPPGCGEARLCDLDDESLRPTLLDTPPVPCMPWAENNARSSHLEGVTMKYAVVFLLALSVASLGSAQTAYDLLLKERSLTGQSVKVGCLVHARAVRANRVRTWSSDMMKTMFGWSASSAGTTMTTDRAIVRVSVRMICGETSSAADVSPRHLEIDRRIRRDAGNGGLGKSTGE